jgi:cytochrome c biogenesis protein CcdA
MEELFKNIEVLIQQHHFIAYFAVFFGGLVSAASPCVLAAIPLIIGYVGGYSEGDRKKAALFSLVYVMGLAITFTVFGITASFIGRFLSLLGSWVYIIFALVAITMGINLMGIVNIPLPFQKSANVKRKGLVGAFLLGVITGFVSSPCATPVLAVILAYAATEGDIVYGGSLLFTYAVAHCSLIFLAGLSVGMAENLIKSKGINSFNIWSKRLSGFILVIAGVYIIYSNV